MSQPDQISFAVLGNLDFFKKAQLKKICEESGHKLLSSISSNVDFLVTNDEDKLSNNFHQHSYTRIPIISEFDFLKMLLIEFKSDSDRYKELKQIIQIFEEADKTSKWSEPQFVIENIYTYSQSRFRFVDSKLFDNETFLIELVKKNKEIELYKTLLNLHYAKIKRNKKILELMFELEYQGSEIFDLLDEDLKSDRELMLVAVKNNGEILEKLSDDFKNDKKIVFAAVRNYYGAFEYASESLKNDRAVVKAAIFEDSDNLEFASDKLKNDKKLVMNVVNTWGSRLIYASNDLKNDKEVVLLAVRQNGLALEYASEELRNNKEVVLEAVRQNGLALEYASEELRNDKEVVLEAVRKNGLALKYASEELRNDKELVKEGLKIIDELIMSNQSPKEFLEILGPNLKKDKSLIIEIIKKDGAILEHVSEELRNDLDIVNLAIKDNIRYFEFAGDKLKNDKNLVLRLLDDSDEVFRYLSDSSRGDVDIVRKALEKEIYNFEYIKIPDNQLDSVEEFLGPELFKRCVAKFSAPYSLNFKEIIEFKLSTLIHSSKRILENLVSFLFKYNYSATAKESSYILNNDLLSSHSKEIFILLSHIEKKDIMNSQRMYDLFKAYLGKKDLNENEVIILNYFFENKLITYNVAKDYLDEYSNNPEITSKLIEYIQTFDIDSESETHRKKIIDFLENALKGKKVSDDEHNVFINDIKSQFMSDEEIIYKAAYLMMKS